MPNRPLRRVAAPLLVVAGVALFAMGAGGIAAVNGGLDAASRTAVPQPQSQPRPDRALDVRDERPHPPHRGRF